MRRYFLYLPGMNAYKEVSGDRYGGVCKDFMEMKLSGRIGFVQEIEDNFPIGGTWVDTKATPLQDIQSLLPSLKNLPNAHIRLTNGRWASLVVRTYQVYSTTMDGDWKRRIEEFAEQRGYRIDHGFIEEIQDME
jgi:hypothetical protein